MDFLWLSERFMEVDMVIIAVQNIDIDVHVIILAHRKRITEFNCNVLMSEQLAITF